MIRYILGKPYDLDTNEGAEFYIDYVISRLYYISDREFLIIPEYLRLKYVNYIIDKRMTLSDGKFKWCNEWCNDDIKLKYLSFTDRQVELSNNEIAVLRELRIDKILS